MYCVWLNKLFGFCLINYYFIQINALYTASDYGNTTRSVISIKSGTQLSAMDTFFLRNDDVFGIMNVVMKLPILQASRRLYLMLPPFCCTSLLFPWLRSEE